MGFDVTRARTERMTFSSSGNNNAGIQVTWHQDYFVEVTGADIATHTVLDVLSATGIPKVNYTVWSSDTTIMPWVICKDKTAERHPKSLTRWTVKTKFSTPQARSGGSGTAGSQESENQPIAIPAAITDIEPTQTVSLGEGERVMYFEKEGPVPRLNTATTPTGNWWSVPVMEKFPVFELKHTQYEDSISYEDMIDRKFKVNNGQWNGHSEHSWLIKDVEASEVEVTLQSGTAVKALVTYTIVLSPDEEYGWKEVRALFDTQYWTHPEGNPERKLKQFQGDVPGTVKPGYITIQGLKRESQSGEPDYVAYQTYDETNFDDFLRLPT